MAAKKVKPENCTHQAVNRAGPLGSWTCTDCSIEFLPMEAIDRAYTDLVTNMEVTMSNILWNFHLKAAEHYGKEVADTIAPPDPNEPCADNEHDWDENGNCTKCPATMFLGGTP